MVPSPANRPMGALDWATLIALSLLWGGSFFFNQVAVADIPVFSVVVGRVALAAAILHAVVRLAGLAMPTDPKIWLAFLGMGLFNNAIPFSLIVWGQTQIGSGLASILNATTPLFTVLVAHRFTADEKITPARLAGVLVGLIGVAVMLGIDALGTLGASLAAQLACLAAALSYAAAGVFGRRFRTLGVSPLATATGQVTASSVLLAPVMLAVDRPWQMDLPGGEALGALVGLAALSTALAYILYFRLLANAGATNLLLVTFLIPVSAIALGVLVLGERLSAVHLAGMALIGLGLALIDGRLVRLAARHLPGPAGPAPRA
ncbi:MAG: DMT family transporter [Rhodospirillaceae bacterium]|nr:DMT family transporter [Rhodospirillaceae bacterium]